MEIYQLKITLKGIRPPIWRRVLVTANTMLAQLHGIIQISMGWECYHLFGFNIYGERYDDEAGALSTKLGKLGLSVKSKFNYTYDFGDDWEHEILVEKIVAKDTGAHYPICLTGKRACPPEDCGGVWGYQSLLDTLSDENNPEYDEMLEWVGENYNPEIFDINEVNKLLGVDSRKLSKSG